MELSDRHYVESCRDGSPEEFRLLVDRYQKPLFAYLSQRLGNNSDAEEAAQDCFVRAFLSLKKLRKPDSFYAWLLGIASRVLKEHFRSRQRVERHRATLESLAEQETSDAAPDYPLEQAIAGLPENCRQVLLLHYYEGLPCHEVGQRLGMPLGTVTKTLSRAYSLLRQDLEHREGRVLTLTQSASQNELR
jgi:RNA polymerase sigma-70 factor (ECF subfamily)